MMIFGKYFLLNFPKVLNFGKVTLYIGLLILFTTCKKEIPKEENSNSNIKYYNGGNKDYVLNIVKTDDGGFLYTGYTFTDVNVKGPSAFLLKVDVNGNQEWYNTYGGKNRDILRSAVSTPDGGFLAVGRSNSGGPGIGDSSLTQCGYIVKTDAHGKMEWEKHINYSAGQSYYTDFYSVKLMPDKQNYIIAGFYSSGGNTVILAKIDLKGNLKFCNRFFPPGTSYNEQANDVIIADDNSIIAAGVMSKSNKFVEINTHLTFILSVKPNGSSANFYNPYFDYVRGDYYYLGTLNQKGEFPAVKLTKVPGGYMFATYIELADAKIVTQLAKTDLAGKILWQKQYAGLGNALVYDMDLLPDGKILLTGSSTKYPVNRSYYKGFESQSSMLIMVDADGNLLWEEYGEDIGSGIIAQCVQAQKEGGWRVASYSSNNTSGVSKMFTFIVDDKGKIINGN